MLLYSTLTTGCCAIKEKYLWIPTYSDYSTIFYGSSYSDTTSNIIPYKTTSHCYPIIISICLSPYFKLISESDIVPFFLIVSNDTLISPSDPS